MGLTGPSRGPSKVMNRVLIRQELAGDGWLFSKTRTIVGLSEYFFDMKLISILTLSLTITF